MEKAETKLEVTAERLVLFADIMGFKDRVMRTKHEKLKKELLQLKEDLARMKPLELGGHLFISQFSDSILIVADGAGAKQANLITQAGVVLMQECLKRGFPLKGAIAQGEFTYDKDNQLFFGRPLVDAYLLQEEVKFYGIVLHHTAEEVMQNISNAELFYEKKGVFMDNGQVSHWNLCWQKMNRKMNFSYPCDWKPWLDQIEKRVSGRPRIYVDNTRMILEEQERKTR